MSKILQWPQDPCRRRAAGIASGVVSRTMRWFFLSIIGGMLVGDAVWWWRADAWLSPLRRAMVWRGMLLLFMSVQVALLVLIVFGRVVSPGLSDGIPSTLLSLTYIWHLLVLPACLVGWLIGTLVILAGRGGRRAWWALRSVEVATLEPTTSNLATRRQFLGAVGVAAAAAPPLVAVAGVGASLAQAGQFRVRSIVIDLPGLPPELDGLRIAHVSDMHVGRFTTVATLRRIVEATSKLDADLVVLPGDLINNALSDLSDGIDAVGNMQSRHGSYLCVGNHDLIENGSEFVRRTKARLPLLIDESRSIVINGHPVQLLGLPWTRGEEAIGPSVAVLSQAVRPGAFPILIAHHPHAFDAAAAAGIPLTLSGHTHGGQLMLTENLGFGPMMFRYWSGLYRKREHNNAALVVSNGVGNWFPVRTNAPAEIIEVTLRTARL